MLLAGSNANSIKEAIRFARALSTHQYRLSPYRRRQTVQPPTDFQLTLHIDHAENVNCARVLANWATLGDYPLSKGGLN